MTKIALFPGSFDPITNGHLHMIERAACLFDEVIVAVMSNMAKQPLFTLNERVNLIKAAVAAEQLTNVRVSAQVNELTVDFAHRVHAQFIIRGLRNAQDFDYENNIAQMNHHLAPDIDTVFLMARPTSAYIASSLVKDVARFHGNLDQLVPTCVATALTAKFNQTK
ncbi:MAG: pantetheine-phosphate adenylyltransferase [Candidatus Paralactobacillus gallistercoris]|uniref:Phosphopantetheine adenylyltransferase n=1 Tax=Candidatus Paralactobacillus gallistercoris TaxID=2838724 RepID=A0A948TIH7_9LACO|nr:pantetheine-phosphate adenylyltransferase [Candidatus Paralactobacillus gallistercoris]